MLNPLCFRQVSEKLLKPLPTVQHLNKQVFKSVTTVNDVIFLAHFLLLSSSSTLDTMRLFATLLVARCSHISLSALKAWHRQSGDDSMYLHVCVYVCEGVNSIPAVEMAFKCPSLCTPIELQTHYQCVCVCMSSSIWMHVPVCSYKCIFKLFLQSSPCSHATLPFCSDLFLIHHASFPVLSPEVSAKV